MRSVKLELGHKFFCRYQCSCSGIGFVLFDGDQSHFFKLTNSSGHMTERAMRGRIREFEKMGLISVEQNETDARTRTLVPTEKFVTQFDLHAAHIQHLLQSNYILIPK